MSATSERYWPAVLAAILILTAALAGGIVWYLTTMLPEEIHVGHSPWSMLAFNNLCAAVSVLFTITSGVTWCIRARSRMQRRQRSVAGDLEAIPLAHIASHPANVPGISAEPLILAWRALGPRGGIARVVILSYLAFLILGVGAVGGLIALSVHFGLDTIAIGFGGTFAVVFIFVAMLARVMRRLVPTRRVERLVATSSSLLWQRTGARDREIPWYDARLFEIWRPDGSYGQHALGYILYGRKETIAWHIPGVREATPEGMTASELEMRQSLLFDDVVARTHLAPRTFVTSLQRDWDADEL